MALRITAGHLTIAALSAVTMSAVLVTVDRTPGGSQILSANTTFYNCYQCDSGSCVADVDGITIDWWHTGDSAPPPTCEELGAISAWEDINNNGGIDPGETCNDKCALSYPGNSSSSSVGGTTSSTGGGGSSVSITSAHSSSSAGGTTSSTGGGGSSVSTTSTASSWHSSSSSSYAAIPPVSSSASSFIYSSSSPASSTSHSSVSSGSSSSASSTSHSSSSSSSSGPRCGDGIKQATGPGPDGIVGTADDMEQCDDANTVNDDSCSNTCTVPRCGDGIKQAFGPNGVDDPDGPVSDDEECDDGAGNTAAGPLDASWCSLSCKKPECSNGRDQHDVGAGGETIPDADADAGDGGCYQVVCNKTTPYLPGKNDEDNPCAIAAADYELGTGGEEGSSGGTGGSPGETSGGGGVPPGAAANLLAQAAGGCVKGPGAPVAGGGGCAANESCRVLFPGGPTGCMPLLPEGGGCATNFDCAGGAQCVANGGDAGICTDPNGAVFPVCPPGVVGGGECGDGRIGPGEVCDDGNDDDDDACDNSCNIPGAPVCGDGTVNAGEECDDGNTINTDICNNSCELVEGGMCTGNECSHGGASFCAVTEVCQNISTFPCIECEPIIGGECKGDECANGGDAAADALDMDCSLTATLPCVEFIPRNSCGNGKIDSLDPPVVEEGCHVTGASNQLCLPDGATTDETGEFYPWFTCYHSADCVNTGESCAWAMTPELVSCLSEEMGGSPGIGVQVRRDSPAPSALLAQVGGDACPRDLGFCGCDAAGAPVMAPRGADCEPACPAGVSMNNCPEGNGTACQPYICTDGRVFPTCNDRGEPIGYLQHPCNAPVPPPPSCSDPLACTKDKQNCCNEDGDVVVYSVRDGCSECQFTACPDGTSYEQCTQIDVCMRCGMSGEVCTFVGADCAAPGGGFLQENSCYDSAICEWTGTRCAWRETEELEQCLEDNAGGTCPTGQSCMSASACGASGGSAGNACGSDNTKVCCTVTDDPLEECDDGNQIDDDACSNTCTRNCQTHSDCPEGACVDGTCTDQCVEPDAAAFHPAAPPVAHVDFLMRLMAGGSSASFTLFP